jgi:signal transduction histidine kinase/CheY-like chemotaxis protein/HPt (histidine-containing phosphotransfer) domain-containing protein
MTSADSIPADHARRADWHQATVNYLAQGALASLCGYVLAGVAMVIFLWQQLSGLTLLIWLASMTVIHIARAIQVTQWQRQLRAGSEATPGSRLFLLGTIVAGLGWAASWSFVPLAQGAEYRHFVTIILCAVAAGSVLNMGAFAAAERAFLAIVILPMIPSYWLAGSAIAMHASAAAVLFLAVLLRLTDQFSTTLTRMIHQHFENAGLLADLSAAKIAADSVNKNLSVQLAAQQVTESALIAAKEQAEQAARAKAEFLANMSHEIRTPMNGVLGMTELLLRTELSKKQRSLADNIRRSGENLLGIINDILDFSKIEAGKLEIQTVTFNLRTLIEDVGAMFAPRAEQTGVDFTCGFDAHARDGYAGDPERIRQILTNLIGNALKFTRSGAVAVTASAEARTARTTSIRFEVRDTGIGIAAEHQARIFDSFVQADGSTTRKFGGTGLGLAICKQLTRLMGGEIGLESTPGRGSTFWFTVPLQIEHAGHPPESSVGRVNFAGKRVLIAEENRENRELLTSQLTAWRARHATATSRDDALGQLRQAAQRGDSFDCVIIDYGFAGNGLSFVARLRRSPPFPVPKFLLLTGVSSLQETGQWMAAGIDAYVDKPIRQHELQTALAKLLLPAGAADLTAAADPRSMSTDVPEAHFDARLLVAEDNVVNQELIRGMLGGLGSRIEVVANGRQAVDAFTRASRQTPEDSYRLLLIDCQMPELDGFAATRIIRDFELRTEHPRLPIIAITANALQGDRERCLAAGMDDYLTKPFTRAQLVEILQRWLPLPATRNSAVSDAGRTAPVTHGATRTAGTLDLGALREIQALQRPGAPDILAKVVALFEEAAPRLIQNMGHAVTTHDCILLQQTAHSLKSSSASLGAIACTELCRELEALARNGDVAAAASKVEALTFALDAAIEALRQQARRADAHAA